jgi:predicted DsbA family dithiol-disulfide isomerase
MSVTSGERGRIGVISDVICPWCYIGKHHLGGALPILAAQGQPFAVTWHAFQLNPDMPEEGVDRDEYRARKFGSLAKSQEADARVAEAGAALGLEFRHDLMRRTPNSVAAHRVIWLAGGLGVQEPVVEALFRGYFTEGRDIGCPATLAELAGEAGLDPALVVRLFSGGDGRQQVLGEDASARKSGLDGVPTFVMGQYVLFSGAVPAEQMAEAFAKAWKVIGNRAA